MAITTADIQALQDQIDILQNNLVEKTLSTEVTTKEVEALTVKLKQLNAAYNNLQQNNTTGVDISILDRDFKNSKKLLDDLTYSVANSNTIFDKMFGELKTSFGEVTNKLGELNNVWSNIGENAKFWTEYKQRINDISAAYGLSGQRLKEFEGSSRDIQSVFVGTGKDIKDLNDGIKGLYDVTNETNEITPEFAKSLGDMSYLFDMSTSEVGRFIGVFKNLNIAYKDTEHILEDLRYAAEKSALNTSAVLKVFTDNFARLNEFSFKNGIQGMIEMVKQSARLKTDMNAILNLSDELTDPEKTIEFASNLQVLGGSFAQLGDFNQLMYDAAVAPEELAKNIAKATSNMGTFNKETGKLDISFADRMQLKEVSKFTNMTVQDLEKMAVQMHKVSDIKMALNFQPLSDESYETLATMAEFKGGKYEIGGKAVTDMNLTDDGIQKLVGAQKDSMEDRRISKMTVDQLAIAKIEQGKFLSPDTTFGLNSGEMVKKISDFSNIFVNGIDGLFDTIKKGPINDLEKMGADMASKNIGGVLKNAGEAVVTFADMAKASVISMIDSFHNEDASKRVKSWFPSEQKEFGDILTKKYDTGSVLDGPSHMEGGIPFTIDNKSGFEAEGGEIILTKGVSQDPNLLSIASKLNEIAGGKKLFEKGSIVNDNMMASNKIPDINVENNNYNKNYNNLTSSERLRSKESIETLRTLTKESTQEINKISKISTDTIQGGLSNKRGDIDVKNMSVSGNISIGGDIKFSPIEVKINGDTTNIDDKELAKTIQDTIMSKIKEELNKSHAGDLYQLTMNQKGTGLPGEKPIANWYR